MAEKKTTKTSTKAKKSAPKKSPANRDKTGTAERDSKGRFVKGVSGNPQGRPKLPVDIYEYASESPRRLRKLADDPETPIKVRADIEKWFAEMAYGKARQQLDVEAEVQNTGNMTVSFEGELDDWSI